MILYCEHIIIHVKNLYTRKSLLKRIRPNYTQIFQLEKFQNQRLNTL